MNTCQRVAKNFYLLKIGKSLYSQPRLYFQRESFVLNSFWFPLLSRVCLLVPLLLGEQSMGRLVYSGPIPSGFLSPIRKHIKDNQVEMCRDFINIACLSKGYQHSTISSENVGNLSLNFVTMISPVCRLCKFDSFQILFLLPVLNRELPKSFLPLSMQSIKVDCLP